MHIDPALRRVMEAMPAAAPPDPDDTEERCRRNNEGLAHFKPPAGEGVRVEEHKVEVEGGQLVVRTHTPQTTAERLPAVLFLHGGDWHMGNLDSAEAEFVLGAADLPAVVAFADYRLAPEHKFPMPLDDCAAAYRWMLGRADELGIDPGRIAVAGTSAGANLAAALCLKARHAGWTMPCAQLLDVPCLDLTLGSASVAEFAQGSGITGAQVEELVRLYVRHDADRRDPYASPLLAPDLTGLPPALLLVAEQDPVRDDGERYLERLHEAGVEAASFRVLAHLHQTWMVPGSVTWALVRDLKVAALRRAFAGTLAPFSP